MSAYRPNAAVLSFVIIAIMFAPIVAMHAGGEEPSSVARANLQPNIGLDGLALWDDGYAEMCYYKATDIIYRRQRMYTRVHMVNRQWMDKETGVKAKPNDPQAVPVFKITITEEVPTANYNYRYLTSIFLERQTLKPFKMVLSSQEWCGTTFKHLRWRDGGATLQSFSYFAGEGDRVMDLPDDAVPFEALFFIARDVAATGQERTLNVLTPQRSNHQVKPTATRATLTVSKESNYRVMEKPYTARRVELHWDGPNVNFVVESKPPYRLLTYETSPLAGALMTVERRPYWEQDSRSVFYKQNGAP